MRARVALVSVASLAALAAIGCGGGARTTTRPDWPPRGHDMAQDPWSASAVAFAHAQVGRRYCWGGNGPGCFDCSGLVQAAWGHGGVRLPHGSEALAAALAEVGPEDARAGDILWWPGHVALYVGAGTMVEAQGARAGVVRRRATPPDRVLRVLPVRAVARR
jgi:cell wall-associated NlpC family hydrolase